jgi:hypothetical protein
MQEKMFDYMEHEMDSMNEADKWKVDDDDEEEQEDWGLPADDDII